MRNFALAAIAAGLVSGPALAGNVAPVIPQASSVAPALAAGSGWAGLYGGITGGFVVEGTTTYRYDLSDDGGEDGDFYDLGGSAFGGFVGYNIDVAGFVLGGEVAYQVASYAIVDNPELEFTSMVDLKLRAGLPLGQALVYGFGGLSLGQWDNAGFTTNPAATGLNLGAGVDMMISDRLFVGVEYIHRNLFTEFNENDHGVRNEFGTVQGRVGFRF